MVRLQLPHRIRPRMGCLSTFPVRCSLIVTANVVVSLSSLINVTPQFRQFRIDVAGSCASNENFTNLCPHSNGSDCDSIFGQYYFYVAAENSICKEYISEKYWSRVHYPSVPIVMRRYIYEAYVSLA